MSFAAQLCFVLADVATPDELTAIQLAAGCTQPTAGEFAAVYAGPCLSERRVAEHVSEWLWLPVSSAPQLASAAFAFGDEADPRPWPAGRAALEIAARHRGGRAALVVKAAHFDAIARELCALTEAGVASSRRSASHPAVRLVEVRFEPHVDVAHRAASAAAIRAFLVERGARRIAHPGGTLLDHLERTAARLCSWGASAPLGSAGLCHAAYGTAGFEPTLLPLQARCTLAELIGVEAEAIVYAYASCDRSRPAPTLERPFISDRFCARDVPLAPVMVRQLAMLSCANELDVLAHAEPLAASIVRAIARLLRECEPLLPPIAASAVRTELDRLAGGCVT